MTIVISAKSPSTLYRQQIQNITFTMRCLVARTILYPLRNMKSFNRVNRAFANMINEANLSCDALDKTRSFETKDKTTDTILTLITELVYLKNNASILVKQGASSRL